MNYETEVLKAILRLSRRRNAAEADSILVRVGGQISDLRAALRKLEQSGLVHRIGDTGGRLTLPGLAVAVAAAATKMNKATSKPARRLSASKTRQRRATDLPSKRKPRAA